MQPLSPKRKWQAITIATLLVLPAFWALLAGIVSSARASSGVHDGPNAAGAIALGLALVPFVFIALAFMSQHPRPPGAVLRAMGLALLIGIPVSALAGDAVTGMVAGLGAGGMCALRTDGSESRRARACGVAIAAAYTFLLIHTVGAMALLVVPVFPLTSLGLADTLVERRAERAASSPLANVDR